MKNLKYVFALVMACAMCFATPIINPPTNDWQEFSKFYGSPNSFDGAGTTARDFVQGTGYYADKASPGQPLPFWGSSIGDHAPDSYGFNFSAGIVNFSLLYEIAGQRDRNILRACDSYGDCITVFDGHEGPSIQPKQFTFKAPWSLVFLSGGIDGMAFYQNGGYARQFATFKGPESSPQFYVAIEDLLGGDNDYNDMILSIKYATGGPDGEHPPSSGEVPEVSTAALAGGGFLLFRVIKRCRGEDAQRKLKL